ncbi:MAG: hypothetical protein LBT21_01650 [Oscillospiraceae bacterium]|nr:hypothetical protein [Oscillospiraceae bacterium]
MLSLAELDEMRDVEIDKIAREKLVEISTIELNLFQTASQRAASYLAQIQNPYCFLCGESVVRLVFNNDGGDLKNHLKNYFISTKQS